MYVEFEKKRKYNNFKIIQVIIVSLISDIIDLTSFLLLISYKGNDYLLYKKVSQQFTKT